jgi:hypothetical protein
LFFSCFRSLFSYDISLRLFLSLSLGNKSTYFLVPSFYGCQSAIFSQRARDYALLANKHIPILYCHLNDHLIGNTSEQQEDANEDGNNSSVLTSLSSSISQLQRYSSALYDNSIMLDKINKKQYRFILTELIKTIKLSISSTNANKAILEMLDLTSIFGNSLLYSILIQMPTSTTAHEISSSIASTAGGNNMALSEINAFLFQPSSYTSSSVSSTFPSVENGKQSSSSSSIVETSPKENTRLLNQLVKSSGQSHQTSSLSSSIPGNEKVDYGAMLEYNALFKYENEHNGGDNSTTGKKKKKGVNSSTKRGSVGENNRRITNWKDFFPLIISSEWNDSNTINHQHHYILPPYVLSEISYAWLPRFFSPDVIKLCRNDTESVASSSSSSAVIKNAGSIRATSPSKVFPSSTSQQPQPAVTATVPSANDYEKYIYNNLLMLSMSKENPSLPESCGILFEEMEASLLSVMNSTHSIIHTRLTADIRMKLRNMNKLEMRVTACVLTLWQLVQYLQCNLLEQYYLHLSSVSISASSSSSPSSSPSSFLSTLLSSVVSSVSWSSCLNAFNLWQLSRIMIKISDILSFPWKQIMELSKVQKLRQSILLINTPTGLLSSSSLSVEQEKDNDQKILLQELLSKELFQQGIASLMDSFSNIHYSFYDSNKLSSSSSSAKEKKDKSNKTATTKTNDLKNPKLAMFNIFNVLKGEQTIPIEMKGKAAREARRTITMMMSNKGEKPTATTVATQPQEEQINQNNSNNLKRVSALFASPKPFTLASSSGIITNDKKQSLLMPPPSFSTSSPASPVSKSGKSPAPPSVSFATSSSGPTPSVPLTRNPNSLRAQKQQRKHLKKLEETRNLYLDSLLSLSFFSIHEKLPNIHEILKDQLISHISASSPMSTSLSTIQDAQESIQASFFQRISSMISYYLAEVIIHQISLQEMKDEMERLQQQHPTKRRSSLLVPSPNAATGRRHPSFIRRQSLSKNRSPSPSANTASSSPSVSPDKSPTPVSAIRQPSAADLSKLANLASTDTVVVDDEHEQHQKQLSNKLEKTEENLLKLVSLINETKNEIHQKDQYKDSDKMQITSTTSSSSSLKKQKSHKKNADTPEALFGSPTKVINHRASNKINITSVLTNFRNKLNEQGGKEASSSSTSSKTNISPDIMFGSLFPEDMMKCMLKWTFDGNQIQEIHQRRQSMNFLLNKSSSIANMSRSNSVLLGEAESTKDNQSGDSNQRRRSSVVDTAFIEEFTTPHIVNTRKINRKRILRSIIAYAGKIKRGEVKWPPRNY